MSVNMPVGVMPNNVSNIYKPVACAQQYMPYAVSNPLAPLEQDCFVKTTTPDIDSNKTPTEDVKIGTSYAYKSVSDLQSKLRSKQRDLEFNKRQLSKYPNNPEYGMKIDKLEKEIKELERQIARAC